MDRSIDSQKSKSFNFESKDIKRDNPSILNAKIQKPKKFKELKVRASDFFKKHKKITIIFGLLIIVLFIIGLIILLNQPSQKDSSKNTKSWSEELTILSQQLEELKSENKEDSLDKANSLILTRLKNEQDIDRQLDIYNIEIDFWEKYSNFGPTLKRLLALKIDSYSKEQRIRYYNMIKKIYWHQGKLVFL